MDNSSMNASAMYFQRRETDNNIVTGDHLKYYYTCTGGRISRLEYFVSTILLYATSCVFSMFLGVFATVSIFSGNFLTGLGALGIWVVFGGILSLVLMIMAFIAGAKRAHDRNRSGWFVLLYFVPLLNLWPFIELYFFPGTVGDNLYGNDPLERFGTAGYPPPQPYPSQPQPQRPGSTPGRPFAAAGAVTQAPPTAQAVATPRLLAVTGEYANMTIPLDAGGVVIGRDASCCNLVLNSSQISRRHAKVSFSAETVQFLVQDLGSTNGVYVGSSRVGNSCTLQAGQSFRLGQDVATFTVLCG